MNRNQIDTQRGPDERIHRQEEVLLKSRFSTILREKYLFSIFSEAGLHFFRVKIFIKRRRLLILRVDRAGEVLGRSYSGLVLFFLPRTVFPALDQTGILRQCRYFNKIYSGWNFGRSSKEMKIFFLLSGNVQMVNDFLARYII